MAQPKLPSDLRKRARESRDKSERSLHLDPVAMGPEIPDRLTNRIRNSPAHEKADPHFFHVVASFEVILECLRINVADPATDPFFGGNATLGEPQPWIFSARIRSVGDTLFALRAEPGFHDFCRRLRKQTLRSAYAECQAALMFSLAGFTLHAQPEVSLKGEDYDFAAVRGQTRINVEVTVLDELASYSSQLVHRRLGKERGQLPKSAPSVIYCGVPESWFAEGAKDLQDHLVEDARAFLRNTSRINAVVFTSESCVSLCEDNSQGQLIYEFLPVFNANPLHWTDELVFLVDGSAVRARRGSLGDRLDDIQSDTDFYRWVEGLRLSS